MSQEIELYSKLNNPIEAIQQIGMIFAKSGLFGVEKTETGMVLAMECLATRKSPSQILREYHIIENRLSDRADSMLAKFNARGGKHKIISRTEDRAEVELILGDQTNKFSLTWEQAQKEPFVHAKEGFKKNWRTPRARMQTMWARVVSDGVRAMDPGAVAGIYTPEEIEDEMGVIQKEIVLPGNGASSVAVEPPPQGTASAAPKRGRPKAESQPVVDVAATVVDQSSTVPAAPKSDPSPAPVTTTPAPNDPVDNTPKPPTESGKFIAKQNDKGELSIETVSYLFNLFSGIENQVTAFLKAKPAWGCTGDKLGTLKLDKAQLIADKFDIFLQQLKWDGDKTAQIAEHIKKVGWTKPA